MTSLLLIKSMLLANAIQQKPSKKKKKKKKKIKPPETLEKKLLEDDDLCRICDQKKGDIPIFNDSVQANIAEDIQHFTGVKMEKSDKLPKHICQNCLDLLNGCIAFKDICQRTNNKLVEKAIKKEAIESLWNEPMVKLPPNEPESEGDRHDGEDNIGEDNVGEDNVGGDNVGEDNVTENNIIDEKIFDYTTGCKHCGKICSDAETLELHLKSCKKAPKVPGSIPIDPKKKFLCDVCGKTVHSNANLLAHKSIHLPIFPFKCDVCPYRGRSMDLLKVHKRTHMADKPFKCPQCDMATTTSSNLAKHIRQVHCFKRPYQCNYCEKAFSFAHDVKKHIKDIHLKQGMSECKLCSKKFNTRKILRGHEWRVHKIKGERQGRIPSYLLCQMQEQSNKHAAKS